MLTTSTMHLRVHVDFLDNGGPVCLVEAVELNITGLSHRKIRLSVRISGSRGHILGAR